MSSIRLVLLCEDSRHESFILGRLPHESVRYLRIEKMGSNHRVIAAYPDEARDLRCGAHQQSRGLIVVIDGDKQGHIARKRQLDDALKERKMSPRGDYEPIAIMAPNRNIETWIVGLLDGIAIVDEVTDYKFHPTFKRKGAARVAGERFQGTPKADETHLPALTDARTELGRLPPRP